MINIELSIEDARHLAAILQKAESMFDYSMVDNYSLYWKPVMGRVQGKLTDELEKPIRKEHWSDNLSDDALCEMWKTL